jgi:ABC-type multidrug transport system fused ATPase/permease subunit
MLILIGRGEASHPSSFDTYSNWNSDYPFGKDVILASYNRDSVIPAETQNLLTDEDKAKIDGNIKQNVTDIADAYPDVDFYIYYTPYSIYYLDFYLRSGDLKKQIDAEKYITSLLLEHENIHVYSFYMKHELIEDPDNYKDLAHHGQAASDMILEWIHEKEGELNKDNYEEYYFDIYQSSFLFIAVKLLMTIFTQQVEFRNVMLSERITNEMNALLYEKILNGNTNSPNASQAEGEKMNLVEVDSEKIGYLFFVGPKIISMPLRVLISIILLFNLFGSKFIYAIFVLSALIGLILLLQVAYLRNLEILLEKKDDRMRIVTYIFQIIKNIKINGWEDTFAKKIKESRNEELHYLRKNFNIDVIRTLINSNMPLVMLIVSLGIYVFSNKALEISDLFTFLQLITLMTSPLMAIPLMISEFFSNLISITRLQKFLFTPEHDFTSYEDRNSYLNDNLLVKFDKATFGVTNTTDLPEHHQIDPNSSLNTTLGENTKLITDISFSIKKGEFIAILGQTGSGKSVLINSIMNNFTLLSNRNSVIVNGTISYDPQQAWVMNDTIKNNILFFNEMDNERYNNVIKVCQLLPDFDSFPKRDENEISSSGGNLSGGQRARVSLARCLYKDADLYLLDDPLASIDAKVGNNIFKEAFADYLKDKGRILITNELSNLSHVDKIIYMDKGNIIFNGDFKEFVKKFGKEYEIQVKEKKEKMEKEEIENKRAAERKKSRRL